jgi:septal ring factor EnvC (AmiA/AmiB activator)
MNTRYQFSVPLSLVVERIQTEAVQTELTTGRRPRYDTDELYQIKTTTGRVWRELRDLRADVEAKDRRLAEMDNRLAELEKVHVRVHDELSDTRKALRATLAGEND